MNERIKTHFKKNKSSDILKDFVNQVKEKHPEATDFSCVVEFGRITKIKFKENDKYLFKTISL